MLLVTRADPQSHKMKNARESAKEQARIASDFYIKCLNLSNERAPVKDSPADLYGYDKIVRELPNLNAPAVGAESEAIDQHAVVICARIGNSYHKSIRLLRDRYTDVFVEYNKKLKAVTFEKYPLLRSFGKVSDRNAKIAVETAQFTANKAIQLAVESRYEVSRINTKSETFSIPVEEWAAIRGMGETLINEISTASKRVDELKTRLNRRTTITLSIVALVTTISLKILFSK